MKKSKLRLISIFCLTSLAVANISFANCPAPDSIYFYCAITKHGKTCYWATDNACFEASAKGFGAKEGDKAGSFMRALWWSSSGSRGEDGTASCFYQGPNGYGIINAFQAGGYGAVPKPLAGDWQKTDKPGMLSCESSDVKNCPFRYCH